MIGLKKKQEEQKAAAAAAQLQQNGNGAEVMESVTSASTSSAPANGGGDAASGGDSSVSVPPATSTTTGRGRGRGRGTAAAAAAAATAGDGGSTTIWGVKGAAAAEKKAGGGRKLKPGEIRVQKDVSELDGGDCATAVFPNPNDLMNFEVIVAPDQGYWQGYQYTFQFRIPDMYPHESPKVKCVDKIYHPNIDLLGNVCLNILRADWKPVLDINAVIYGLIVLFVQPNPDDPLNHDAAKCLRELFCGRKASEREETDERPGENPAQFKINVDRSIRGMDVAGTSFPPAKKAEKRPKA